jgi:hypothetical protein
MERPKISREIVIQAAECIADDVGVAAETIAAHYHVGIDGHELARELEKWAGCDMTMHEAEALDSMDMHVSELLAAAEKKWAEEYAIQPPLPIGTRIVQGIIDGIYEHGAAKYLVKEYGCTKGTRWLLINFESAQAV